MGCSAFHSKPTENRASTYVNVRSLDLLQSEIRLLLWHDLLWMLIWVFVPICYCFHCIVLGKSHHGWSRNEMWIYRRLHRIISNTDQWFVTKTFICGVNALRANWTTFDNIIKAINAVVWYKSELLLSPVQLAQTETKTNGQPQALLHKHLSFYIILTNLLKGGNNPLPLCYIRYSSPNVA